MERLTVAEAATRMGISQDAVRQRIRRDTIEHDKNEDGRVYVYLDPTDTEHDSVQDADHDAYINALKSQIEMLERELADRKEEMRRKDHLLAAALERIPAIEAPSEPRESPETASGEHARGTEPPGVARPSWWRRLFPDKR